MYDPKRQYGTPETISLGTNELLGTDPRAIKPAMAELFSGEWKKGSEIPLWDGKAPERIIDHLGKIYQVSGTVVKRVKRK